MDPRELFGINNELLYSKERKKWQHKGNRHWLYNFKE